MAFLMQLKGYDKMNNVKTPGYEVSLKRVLDKFYGEFNFSERLRHDP